MQLIRRTNGFDGVIGLGGVDGSDVDCVDDENQVAQVDGCTRILTLYLSKVQQKSAVV